MVYDYYDYDRRCLYNKIAAIAKAVYTCITNAEKTRRLIYLMEDTDSWSHLT
jgi:hypothetical protein